MKRIFLSAWALGALLASIKAQNKPTDSSAYTKRKLALDEINLVSSYYAQNGEHASVTGGIGSQKLHDVSNTINLNFIRYDKHLRKQSLDIELGIDYYTSASSDLIDLKANSSASHADARIYPTIKYSIENDTTGTTLSASISSSSESDYESRGGGISFSQKTTDRNGEFTAKLQTYLDKVSIIKPIELRTPDPRDYYHYHQKPRNTFEASLSYSQVINDHSQVMLLADVVQQYGYLSLPFHRVYFKDSSVHIEKLPDSRFKVPLGFRANYFWGDNVIVRFYYRFYTDDWRLTAHTLSLEVPLKLSAFFSAAPFYRFYSQSATKYFSGYEMHTQADNYYTSNYDLSRFNSSFFGTGIRLEPKKGVFGIQHFSMVELRYGHYVKNVQLNSDIVSVNLRWK